jgi:hypothetical protein
VGKGESEISEICPEAPETQAAPTYGGIHWGHYAATMGVQLPFSAVDSKSREAIEAGARAVADAVRILPPEPEGARYALVEQMGYRSTTGTVREMTFCGAPMLEVTDLKTGSVHLLSPQSLYEVTWLTEAEARQRTKPWTAAAIGSATIAIPAADPWGTAESDLDDADDAADADHDEGNDTEAEAKRWIEDRSCRHPRDDEFSPGAAGEARDLTRQAEVNPIEAEAQRATGWFEDHTAQRQM